MIDFFQSFPLPINQMKGSYDIRLVILSYLVATFASYIALDITGRIREIGNTKSSTMLWILGGSFAMGAGIWSMHFIGMLAFSMQMPMSYEPFWTVLSLLVAIFASGFALFILKKPTIHITQYVGGGVIFGLAIASMHYLGMQAMTDDVNIRYIPSLFSLSIIIALLASLAALWFALKSNQVVAKLRLRLKVVSAFIMGAAICGMHYTGMFAAVFTPKMNMIHDASLIHPDILAVFIASITFIILGIAFFVSAYKEALNQELLDSARQAGMAEVSTSVLHNVGNVLNSVNVSVNVISDKFQRSKLNSLTDISELFSQHKEHLGEFITRDERGSKIPEFIEMLASYWHKEEKLITSELESLIKNVQHIRDIISTQQNLSKSKTVEQIVSLESTLEEALLITGLDSNQDKFIVEKKYEKITPILVDKVKLLQILVNLLRNAKDAIAESTNEKKLIIISIYIRDKNSLVIEIADNGIGIAPDKLKKIFTYGFTTKEYGHGFGLHACALTIKEMGGMIKVDSKGLQQGTTFTLELPYHQPKR